jgi:thiol-disulfide isomerase/thioredoxin
MTRTLALILILAAPCAAAFELTGVVHDHEATPVLEATVWLSQDRAATKTVTDSTGGFSFPQVRVGVVQLVARKEGYAIGGLTVEALGPDRIEITLPPPDVVSLRLIDHMAKPVNGARVKRIIVNDAFELFVDDLVPLGFPSIRSNAEGTLTIPAMPKGGYISLAFAHRAYCSLYVANQPVGLATQTTYQMFPGIPLGGRATNDRGEPVTGARVLVTPANNEIQLTFADLRTDTEGFFSAHLVTGLYDVTATHPDLPCPMPRQVQMSDASQDTNIQLVFPKAHILQGSVIGPDDKPMPGVAVAYLVDETPRAEALTDAKGVFRLNALNKGALHVYPPLGYMNEHKLDVLVEFKRKNRIRHTPLHLVPLPKITGTVVEPSGAAVNGALISLKDIVPPAWATTDSWGRFEIEIAAMPEEETITLRAEHPLRLLRRDVTVNLTQVKPLDIRLTPYEPNLNPNQPKAAPNDLSSLVDGPAPDLHCTQWINSGPLTLSDLRGKVVVLTFWNGFDPYSRAQTHIPELLRLYEVFKDTENVAFVMVHDGAEEFDSVKQYVKDFDIEFPVGLDESPFVTFDLYDTNVLPQTVLIDKGGVLRFFDVHGRLLELIKDLRRKT